MLAQAKARRTTQFEKFGQEYYHNPTAFAYDCFKWKKGDCLTAYQEEIIASLPLKKRICVRGAHGLGKCLANGELVQLSDGNLVPVETLIDKSFSVFSVDSGFTLVESLAYAKDNGKQDIVEILTDKGRVIKRTMNHPLWADISPYHHDNNTGSVRLRPKGAWIEAGLLQPGSMVCICLQNPGPRKASVSDDFIKITAYLLGDGKIGEGSPIFTQQDGVCLDEFRECCDRIGCAVIGIGKLGHRIIGGDKTKRVNGGAQPYNPVLAHLRSWQLFGLKSANKHFPDWAWTLPNAQLCIFLSRLFACDGWATCKARGDGRTNREIGYCSISYQLAKDVSRALLRLGIQAEVRSKRTTCLHKGKMKVGVAYTVSVHDADNIKRFASMVGIYGKEDQVKIVRQSAESASTRKTQKWRTHALAEGFAWERIKSIRVMHDEPTVLISVPEHETFVTEFVEHNSTLAAFVILWHALTREACGVDFKIPITASVNTQLRNFLWPEVKKWSKLLRWDKIGRAPFNNRNELLTLELILSNGRAFCVAPEEPAKLEGAHADSLLYVIDESKAVADAIFDAAEGALSGGGSDTGRDAYILTMSTPGSPIGRFYEIQKDRERYKAWHCRHVTTEEVLKAGRMSQDYMEQKRLEWGEESAAYITRVLGKFCSAEENALIPLDWVEQAMLRGQEYDRA